MMKSLSLPTLPIRNRIHPAAQKALGHKSSTLHSGTPE